MFEDAGLLYALRQYPGIPRRGPAGRTKVILADPALLQCMIQGQPGRIGADATRGQLLETVVATHLQAFAKYRSGHVTYWGTVENDVDFVLTIGLETVPVQVTASKSYDTKDGADIRLFLRRHRKRTATGLVLYNGVERDVPVEGRGGVIALRSLPNYLVHLARGSVPPVGAG
jgi:predicted AAA+ superfamily ATPase